MSELEALRIAKNQLTIRVVQLSGCRVCGAQQAEYEQALAKISEMIKEREHVQPRPQE